MILYFVVFTLLLVTNDKYVQEYLGLWQWFLPCAYCSWFYLGPCLTAPSFDAKETFWNKTTWQLHLKNSQQQSHFTRKWRTLCFPPDKGTFFCSDSQQNMNLPCAPCVECLVIMPTVQYEAVQNRWRQQERVSIKRDKKMFSKRFVPCNFLWNICHCLCDLCKLYSTWDQRKYRQCLPFVAKCSQRQSLPCVSIVTPVCCVAITSLVVYSTNTRALTLLLCLPVSSTDITGQWGLLANSKPIHREPYSNSFNVL